jgi:DNA polymerase-1
MSVIEPMVSPLPLDIRDPPLTPRPHRTGRGDRPSLLSTYGRGAGDVEATAAIADRLPVDDYARREMRAMARLTTGITLRGFRVDVAETRRRHEEGLKRSADRVTELQSNYGLPSVKADGKPAKSPQATKDGKIAIAKAFSDLGADLPSTGSGSPALSKKVMSTIIDEFGVDSAVGQLAELVKGLNGERSIYGTILEHLAGDRVHPLIDPRQSSGRLSITKPGLTIMGKRGGKHVEREVFLPEPGELIIAADMSQIDARAIAAHCQDPEYMAMFEPGKDFHTEVALLVFGDASRRDDAKAITHGWNYGESIRRIAADNQIDTEVVKEFDRGMRERFPRLVTWRDVPITGTADAPALTWGAVYAK